MKDGGWIEERNGDRDTTGSVPVVVGAFIQTYPWRHRLILSFFFFLFFYKTFFRVIFCLKGKCSFIQIAKESWYKASKVGGGESSIQYKSLSNVFLAYWANACAILFAPLLMQQTLVYHNPQIKCLISLTTFPNGEKISNGEVMAWITLLSSPSIINLENPASTANSIALCKQAIQPHHSYSPSNH